jgi:hypothetical protein
VGRADPARGFPFSRIWLTAHRSLLISFFPGLCRCMISFLLYLAWFSKTINYCRIANFA